MNRTFFNKIERTLTAMIGWPVYVLTDKEVPARLCPSFNIGTTARSLDIILQDQIGNRWRGRGSAILLNVNAIEKKQRGRIGPTKILTQRQLWKTAAHELAHIVLDNQTPPSMQDEIESFSLAIQAEIALESHCVSPAEPAAPWIGHDAKFIRILAHVRHRLRAKAKSPWLPADGWFFPGRYGLFVREYQFWCALDDEVERLASVPLSRIAPTEPPKRFIDLWRRTVQAWFLMLEHPSTEQAILFTDEMKKFASAPVAVAPRCAETIGDKGDENGSRNSR